MLTTEARSSFAAARLHPVLSRGKGPRAPLQRKMLPTPQQAALPLAVAQRGRDVTAPLRTGPRPSDKSKIPPIGVSAQKGVFVVCCLLFIVWESHRPPLHHAPQPPPPSWVVPHLIQDPDPFRMDPV